jgi:hypothetical protein
MIIQVLYCPYYQQTDIVKHGLSSEGKQRYRCRACREGRGRTFLLEYTYAGQSPAVHIGNTKPSFTHSPALPTALPARLLAGAPRSQAE